MAWHLAQLNIARRLFEPDAPEMADFNNALDAVNESADASPGFVWRLGSDEENQEDDLVFDDPQWLVNLSVWESPEQLMSFIRSDLHMAVMKRRREWFEAVGRETMVLWWVPAGHRPTVAEAQQRLERLREQGSTLAAFNFARPFPPPQ